MSDVAGFAASLADRLDPERMAIQAEGMNGAAKHEPLFELAPELSFDDIWTPVEDAQLVVPAMGLAPGPPHLVTGSWYTGKTLFLATVGLCVAGGKDAFGVWSTKQGKWTHFDHEMGRRHIKRYMQRLRAGLDLDIEDLRGRMSLRILPQLNLTTPNAIDHYSKLLEGSAIATIDPLRAATPGQDENKSEFRQFLDRLAIVSDRTGCTIMVLHHGGKPVEGSERRNTGRGTSAIDDAVQTKFVMTAKTKGAPVHVSHEKTREINQPLDDFYLRIVSDATSVKLVHMEPSQVADHDPHVAEAKQKIAKFFKQHAGIVQASRRDIRNMVGIGNAFETAFSQMLFARQIERSGGKFDPTFTWKEGCDN